jgi:hypothetical protein
MVTNAFTVEVKKNSPLTTFNQDLVVVGTLGLTLLLAALNATIRKEIKLLRKQI